MRDTPPHLFEVGEAERLLPEISEILIKLRKLWHQMEHIEEHRKRKFQARYTGGERIPEDYFLAFINFRRILYRLDEMGVLLRDLRDGVVDFPTLRHGEIVYFCWREGEAQILYWHDAVQGFSGRRPIEEF